MKDLVCDRRRHPRAGVTASALVFTERGRVGRFAIRDLSLGGAALDGELETIVGERVYLALRLPGEATVELKGAVVRREPGRFMISFAPLAPAVAGRIRAAVEAELVRMQPMVMIADASLEVCFAIERELAALGLHAISAATATESAALFERHGARLAAALVGAGTDGATLLARAAAFPHLTRVLLCDVISRQELAALDEGRAHAVVGKPWSGERLSTALGLSI